MNEELKTIGAIFNGEISFAQWFEGQFEKILLVDVLVALLAAFVVGSVIAMVYKKTYRGVLYSPSFGLTLLMLTMITTPIVMGIRTSVTLSMGMVGALSIVRFRTAVKDPLDTAYMFWALTMGILLGANVYVVALVAMVIIGGTMLLISYKRLQSPNGYLLVLHHDEFAQMDIENELRRSVRYFRVRSKTVTRNGSETTVEVRLDRRVNIVSNMLEINGVHEATLVACQMEAGA
ncbi:MAG: DUF4956 domain-containing protein [Clostridia bacterium]|nr:DUF4956 domain-containing protein [Clostridia bacterium]MBR6753468.1 DUF4956 domain-containing protein [Clostridia bacterium]